MILDKRPSYNLVTASHQIEQNVRIRLTSNAWFKTAFKMTQQLKQIANIKMTRQQTYYQVFQAANNIINEQIATLDNNAINQVAATVNTRKRHIHGNMRNYKMIKIMLKQTIGTLNNAQKRAGGPLIDMKTNQQLGGILTEVQALDQLMDALQRESCSKMQHVPTMHMCRPNKKQVIMEQFKMLSLCTD